MSAVVTRSGNSAQNGAWSGDPVTARPRPSVWAGRGEALLCPDRGGAGGGAGAGQLSPAPRVLTNTGQQPHLTGITITTERREECFVGACKLI